MKNLNKTMLRISTDDELEAITKIYEYVAYNENKDYVTTKYVGDSSELSIMDNGTVKKDLIVKINTNSLNISKSLITEANLYFNLREETPLPNVNAKKLVSIDGKASSIGTVTINKSIPRQSITITKELQQATNQIEIKLWFEPDTTTYEYDFLSYIYLDIELNDIKKALPKKKRIPLIGGAEEIVDLFTGDGTTAIVDTVDDNIGIEISHILKKNNNEPCCGGNVRLSIHERLVKNQSTDIEASYLYTDRIGDCYSLNEELYYIDSDGSKKEIADKSAVTALPSGKLEYTDSDGNIFEVQRKEASFCGIKATTKLEGFKNIELFEHRTDEHKQLEEQLDSYKNVLNRLAIAKIDSEAQECTKICSVEKDLSNMDSFKEGVDQIGENYLLTNDEFESVKSIIAQKKELCANEKVIENSISLSLDSLNNSKLSLLDSRYALILQKAKLDNKNPDTASEETRFPTIKAQIEAIKSRKNANIAQLDYLLQSINKVKSTGATKLGDICANCNTDTKHDLNLSLWTTAEQSSIDAASNKYNICAFNTYVLANENGEIYDRLKLEGSEGSYSVSLNNNGASFASVEAIFENESFGNYLLLSESEANTLLSLSNEITQIERPTGDTRDYTVIDNYINLIDQIDTITNQIELVDRQINSLNSSADKENWADLLVQKNNIAKQRSLLDEQLDTLKSRSDNNIEMFMKYYKEYLLLNENRKILNVHMPINYIVGDSGAKGFNEYGDLVVIYDKQSNYVAFEYEFYYQGAEKKHRVARLYDKNDNEVLLKYDHRNLLVEIINSSDKITKFEYTSNGYLNKVIFPNQETLQVNTFSVEISNEYESARITRSEDLQIASVVTSSTIQSVSYNQIETGAEAEISRLTFEYAEDGTVSFFDIGGNGCKYKFDENGNVIEEQEIERSFVVSANQYVYNDNLCTSIVYPTKNSLHKHMDEFTFVEDYSISKEYDIFGKVIKEKLVGVKKITETATKDFEAIYTYNKNDQVTKIQATVNTNDTDGSCTKTYIQLFEYNKSGALTKKQSYIEGEEYITGINCEEHKYNKNGFETRVIMYNSLDPSSKYYSEQELDENGKLLSVLNQTGDNKIVYADNTAINPNGSKLSYGFDAKNGCSAITQSTAEGDENYINRFYCRGLLTRVTSGDSVYDYSYDNKGRVINVSINQESYVNISYQELDVTNTAILKYSNGLEEKYFTGPTAKEKTRRYQDLTLLSVDMLSNGNVYLTANLLDGAPEYFYSFVYDSAGNITKISKSLPTEDGSTTEIYSENYSYNSDGNVLSKTIYSQIPRLDQTFYSYDDTRKLKSYTCAGGLTLKPKTDKLGRSTGRDFVFGGNDIYSESISYLKQGDHATNMPRSISYGRRIGERIIAKEDTKYKYDNMGNVCEIRENGALYASYEYDALGRLVRENNKALGYTYVIAYDNDGNITSKKQYAFTTKCNEYLEEQDFTEIEYQYHNGRLVSFNGAAIEYDSFGNLTVYKDESISWCGISNKPLSYGANTFAYDRDGNRTYKNNEVMYSYDYAGKILRQADSQNEITYFYDYNSSIVALSYFGQVYVYKKDIFGNVTEILDFEGNTVVKYVYDAWGNHEVIDYTDFGLGEINPFRYRSYYYDTETGLYYLKSRYYDPQTGRFISMDGINYLDPETIGGTNLYAYCNNNPVMYVDPTGHSAVVVGLIIGLIIGAGIGFGAAAYIDYSDDGEIFNGSVAWYDYLGAIITGGIIGGAIGAGIGYIAPAIPSILSSTGSYGLALANGGTATISITGAQILEIASLLGAAIIMFSKNNPNYNSKAPFNWTNKGEGIDAMKRHNMDAHKAADDIMNSHFDNWHKGAGTEHNAIKKWLDRVIRKFLNGGK